MSRSGGSRFPFFEAPQSSRQVRPSPLTLLTARRRRPCLQLADKRSGLPRLDGALPVANARPPTRPPFAEPQA